MPSTLFISDLHLGPEHAGTLALFRQFVNSGLGDAEALYILGDLFEAWAGDDDTAADWQQEALALLQQAGRHCPLYLMHGNRDFLMGEPLARACGATLIDDPSCIDLYGVPTLLSHGDAFCSDDTAYQTYRSEVRTPAFRDAFLARPLPQRKAEVAALRAKSIAAKQYKAEDIMDVNDGTVCDAMLAHRAARVIHGHTHRPAHHELNCGDTRGERWVLGDWQTQATALRCSAAGCSLERV